ncbi:MAG: T9SS type A sorting domain-containing protein [Candidatus Cloacimonetes bacterium]|nr:T9SS type A sorting domain-containing protein [Candidatus Cloacimonadota bacterium]
MKRPLVMLLLLLAAALAANPTYYPLTTIAESCVLQGNAPSNTALANLANVLAATHRGELIAARLYHNSGALSSPSVEDRFAWHNATSVPTVVFNGNEALVGAQTEAVYAQTVAAKRFQAAPVKLQITSFTPASGAISVSAWLLDPNVDISGQTLALMLVEDNVGTETNVTRQIKYQTINLPGSGDPVVFTDSFAIDPGWNQANLWAIAAVQTDVHQILQSASTLPLPTYNIRAAIPWDPAGLSAAPNTLFSSETLAIFNTGSFDTMQVLLLPDDAPADWFFNYCDEIGGCYPGDQPLPLVLGSGDSKEFHLNLWVGSPGTATFHYEISSPNLGTFTIPFVLQTSTSVSDQLLQPALRLESNSPNPFRGSTAFQVTAAKSGPASIQVFDAKGRLIAETPVQNLGPGSHRIDWQAPSGLPSGIYLYRLKDASAPPRRMLLLK